MFLFESVVVELVPNNLYKYNSVKGDGRIGSRMSSGFICNGFPTTTQRIVDTSKHTFVKEFVHQRVIIEFIIEVPEILQVRVNFLSQ
ncbi:hypothetical protein TcasGA2_TC013903 [Tribolium castaneum]|uniref:Uncharacterized protein n=1 Tax=Tribolium castaneum TaxID=7070 RepID=D6WMP3_TRICA|nr:hypothetical protein TcasGA2_TC013903 [Tribolium castaneum]